MAEYKFQADISKFSLITSGYNGENALFLADCATLAYEKEAIIKLIRSYALTGNVKL